MRHLRWPLVLLGLCSLLSSLVGCRPGSGPRHPRDDGADCDEGNATACYRLGSHWSRRGTEPGSRSRAWRYLKMSCEGRHPKACKALRRLDEAACLAGNARGCWNLAETYRLGKPSIRVDLPRARRYYGAACQDSFARACYRLGVLWRRSGKPGRARRLLRKACRLKHRKACKMLQR